MDPITIIAVLAAFALGGVFFWGGFAAGRRTEKEHSETLTQQMMIQAERGIVEREKNDKLMRETYEKSIFEKQLNHDIQLKQMYEQHQREREMLDREHEKTKELDRERIQIMMALQAKCESELKEKMAEKMAATN